MTLEVVVPRGRLGDVESAIKSRRAWILKHYGEIVGSRRVLDEEAVMFGGIPLRIVFEEDYGEEELRPELARGEVLVRASEKSRVRELIRRWFLKETSKFVVQRAAELSRELGLKYKVVDVREIRNWGYCTKNGRLSFGWQLIALPDRLRDYVVIHELSHLVEFNHSAAFKRRLATLCPDYRQREAELDRIIAV